MNKHKTLLLSSLFLLTTLFLSTQAYAKDVVHLGCKDLKTFSFGPEGGEYTYHHAKVVIPKGALKDKTEFTARICPGSIGEQSLIKDLPFFRKNKDGSKGELVKGIEQFVPSNDFASIELKAPKGLNVADGHWLNYCLIGTEKAPAGSHVIFHNEKMAPTIYDHLPSTQNNCVRFRSLSLWHHLKHAAGSVAHGVSKGAGTVAHGVEKGAEATAHGIESAADKVAHVGEDVGKDVAKGAEKGLHALEGLLHPCDACKMALGSGIKSLTCSTAAKQAVKELEECAVKVSETEPEIAEFSEGICGALEAGIKTACKAEANNNKIIAKLEDKLVSSACHAAHLCH